MISPNAAMAMVAWFVACLGIWVYHVVRGRRSPGAGPDVGSRSEPVTAINGLPLPPDLLALVEAGRWTSSTSQATVDRLFPAEPGARLELKLYTLDYMPFENKYWWYEDDPEFLGAPDEDRAPGDIDPKRSVLVGDLGHGSDQPIALDYRLSRDEPRVLTLDWSQPERGLRWVVIAPNVRVFAELLGL